MKPIIYLNDCVHAFTGAHEFVWESQNAQSLTTEEQIKGWKNIHHAKIFGGHYDKDELGHYNQIATRAIGVEFESMEAYYMFLMAWS